MTIRKFKKNIQDDMWLIEKSIDITRIIEEYANDGFEIISRKLDKDPDYFNEHSIFIEDLLDK